MWRRLQLYVIEAATLCVPGDALLFDFRLLHKVKAAVVYCTK